MVNRDVQAERDAAVLSELSLYALGHRLAPELENAAVLGLSSHGLDAEAACRRVPGEVGKDLGVDGDSALLVFDFNHGAAPFDVLRTPGFSGGG